MTELTNLLQTNLSLLLISTAILGLVVGSFLNVVIHRLPIMLERQWKAQCRELLNTEDAAETVSPYNLAFPRSQCPSCGHPLRPLENIPLIGYLWLRGRCAACRRRISLRYPLVELLSAGLAVLVIYYLGFGWQALAALALSWALIALSLIDYDHHLLPDVITLPFLWLGLLLNSGGLFTDATAAIIGAISGYLLLWLVYHGFKAVTGKEGMGYGDFKLLAMLGAWLGWQALPAIIVLASLAGVVVGLSLVAIKKQSKDHPIPFGPYLAIAGWLALIWRDDILSPYLSATAF